MKNLDVGATNRILENAHPEEILSWSWKTFGPLVAASSSFQTNSVPLLHMISRAAADMTIFFLDTGFHFPETLSFRDALVREYGLNVKTLTAEMGHEGFLRKHGELYQSDPDLCCHINKVEPLDKARRGLRAWISGIRRDQTASRKGTPVFSQLGDGSYKICPLAMWSRERVQHYAQTHHLPAHPLAEFGYASIGCAPCTRPVSAEEDERDGRWAGLTKTECGLHLGHLASNQLPR
jgi:phosphoadenosine phosphosulfate reductase